MDNHIDFTTERQRLHGRFASSRADHSREARGEIALWIGDRRSGPRRTAGVENDAIPARRPRTIQVSMSRTSGRTLLPYNSIQRIMLSCGNVPALYFRSKRERPRALAVAAILRATVSGEPT